MLFKNCNGPSKYIHIFTAELYSGDECGGGVGGLGKTLYHHSLHRKSTEFVWCVECWGDTSAQVKTLPLPLKGLSSTQEERY